jgi:mono/diheme cytochrome c family protein
MTGAKHVAALACGLLACAAPMAAQDDEMTILSGRVLFRTHCATCHGDDAKGDGPMTDSLRYRPPDLTLIARRHRGSFPVDKVDRIIDGRRAVKGHGGPEMPVWGDAFKTQDAGYDEAAVRAKISALVEYLRSIQAR